MLRNYLQGFVLHYTIFAKQDRRTHSKLLRRDGTEFAVDDSTAPIHDRQGIATGLSSFSMTYL